MNTLLILSKETALAAAVRSVVSENEYQTIVKDDVWEAESLLSRGAIDLAIVDADLTDVRAIRILEELKNSAPAVPIIVYTGSKQWEWEEDAYLIGVEQVLTKPVRGKMLNALLRRFLKQNFPSETLAPPSERAPRVQPILTDNTRALEAFRNFSAILAKGLSPEPLLKEFLLLLRQLIGVNRAMIFLRKPAGLWSEGSQDPDDRWMRCACAIGLEQTLLDHFALSLSKGIGGLLYRQGRILRAHSPESQSQREILKEFHLLGADVAIPILDRESMIGVAVLDERLTGQPYGNEELAILFHILEEVGLAIKNSWLHNEMRSNHEMLVDLLSHLASGCVVVGSSMDILHANESARSMLAGSHAPSRRLEFSDLPQELGSRIFAVIKTGFSVPPFKFQLPGKPNAQYQITISAFSLKNTDNVTAALLLIEDITQLERSQQLEIEASNLRLLKAMAEHLAHEIGNSLVPLSTHEQLLSQQFEDPDFRKSLATAMNDSVKRISRLSNQMMFLARDRAEHSDMVKVSDVIQDAYREANLYHSGKPIELHLDSPAAALTIAGDRKALRHAFLEVLLNALQANPAKPEVAIDIRRDDDGAIPQLNIEVRDTGKGFSVESANKAVTPFYSTRNVGLGLGLTVTRKIIEDHKGNVEIGPPDKAAEGVVRISLPLSN